MKGFVHVYIRPKADESWSVVETTLNKATDWFRYDQGAYLLFTGRSVDAWHALLKTHVEPDGSLLICRLDMTEYQGYMSVALWEWLDDKKKSLTSR